MTQQEHAVGIDLGTTYSCIAYIDDYDQAIVIPNQENGLTTPSVVLFEDDKRVVGNWAKNIAKIEPENVVDMVKRSMGDENFSREYQGKEYSAPVISSYIISKVVDDAKAALANYSGYPEINKVVITCPAYFGVTQRDATRQAAEIAGLEVLAIITEPVAAAIAWGAGKKDLPDKRVLVYDLGGGTFDITFIEIIDGDRRVIHTHGDYNLGGRNWDEVIVEHLALQFMEEHRLETDPRENPQTRNMLFEEAENLKKSITQMGRGIGFVQHEGLSSQITVSREEFDSLTGHLLESTISLTNELLSMVRNELKYEHPDFDEILLVGGSTYMPQVAERLEQEYGKTPIQFDPDQAVARGAALYAHGILNSPPEPNPVSTDQNPGEADAPQPAGRYIPGVGTVTQVTSHSFGIIALERQGSELVEMVSNLIKLSTPLPTSFTEEFQTPEAMQRSVNIRIVENSVFGDRAEVIESTEIGSAILPLPAGLPAGSPVEVTFMLDDSGLLLATGKDLTGGEVVSVELNLSSRMTEEEVKQAYEESQALVIE